MRNADMIYVKDWGWLVDEFGIDEVIARYAYDKPLPVLETERNVYGNLNYLVGLGESPLQKFWIPDWAIRDDAETQNELPDVEPENLEILMN